VIASTVLDYAYKHESNVNVRERILLVRRIISDGEDIVLVSKEELHRSRDWAYKWLRFDNDGLDGLKDRHRSGRPPDVPKEMLSKIRTELSENPSGWKAKEIMDIIYKRTGVRYHHEVHVYRLLHKWGFRPKVPQRRFVNIASKEEKEQFKKRWKK